MGNEFSGLPVENYIRLSMALGGNMYSCHSKHRDSETQKGLVA